MVDLPLLSTLSGQPPLAAATMPNGAEAGGDADFAALLALDPGRTSTPEATATPLDIPSLAELPLAMPGKLLPDLLPPTGKALPDEAESEENSQTEDTQLTLVALPSTPLWLVPQAIASPETGAVPAASGPETAKPATTPPATPASVPVTEPAAKTNSPVPPPAAPVRPEIAVNLVLGAVSRPLKPANDGAQAPASAAPAKLTAAPTPSPTAPRTPAVTPTALDFAAPRDDRPMPDRARSLTRSVLSDSPEPVMPTSLAAPAPAVAMAPVAPASVAASAPTGSTPGHDIANLVDRLVEARDAAQASQSPQIVQAALRHAEFGAVHVRIATTSERLDVSLSAADPDFTRTVQAAAPIATSTATSDSTAQGQGSGGAYGQSASGAAQGQGSGSGGHHTASTAQPRGERQNDARETRSQRETREDTPADPRRRGILA